MKFSLFFYILFCGSLIGAVGVILGLYIVLWGKAKDNTGEKEGKEENLQIDVSSERARYNNDLEEPLLPDKTRNINEINEQQF